MKMVHEFDDDRVYEDNNHVKSYDGNVEHNVHIEKHANVCALPMPFSYLKNMAG